MLLGAIQPLPPVRQLSMMLPRLLRRNSFMIACILALRNSSLPAGMRSSQKPNSRGFGTSGTPSGRLSDLMFLGSGGRCGGRSITSSSTVGGGAGTGGRRTLDLGVELGRPIDEAAGTLDATPELLSGRELELEAAESAGPPADDDRGGGGAEARARRPKPVDVRSTWQRPRVARREADIWPLGGSMSWRYARERTRCT